MSPALDESPWHPREVQRRSAHWRLKYRKDQQHEMANALGYILRIPPQKAPFNSHGQEIYSNGDAYITADVDSHIGGRWKQFDRNGRRLGTFDDEMNRIGD